MIFFFIFLILFVLKNIQQQKQQQKMTVFDSKRKKSFITLKNSLKAKFNKWS